MSDLNCYIVKDLLPLYIDRVCSEETEKDMEAHLKTCESCRKLYEQMNTELPVTIDAPEFEEKKVFRHARKDLLGILAALLVTILCCVLNFGNAWMGGPAPIGNLLVSVGYVLFWTLFTVKARKYMPFVNLSLAISCMSLISSAVGLEASSHCTPGSFLMTGLAFFTAVPFYGFRCILEWNQVYAGAAVLSAAWVGFTFWMKYRLAGGGLNKQQKHRKYALKKRLILTAAFLISLTPMLLNQYGGARNVQEVSGMINLFNPIGGLAVILYLLGVWGMFRQNRINRILGIMGTTGIVLSELYEFMTWHTMNITGEINLITSFRFAFPEFYVGLAVSVAMIAAYVYIDKHIKPK